MDAKLVVVGGKASADEFQLKLPTIVGRSRTVDLPVGHPLISRQHCELFEDQGRLMVRDLGSLNGTFIDDNRLSDQPAVLRPGGLLTVGAVTFQAVYAGVTEPSVIDEGQPNFSFVETGSVSKIAQIKQTIHGEPIEDLEPSTEQANENARAGSPAAQQPSGAKDDDFDLNWLQDDDEEAESLEDTGPENTIAKANFTAALPEPAQPKKPNPTKPAAASPAAETIFFGSAGVDSKSDPKAKSEATKTADAKPPASQASSVQAGADEEDLDDFFNSLK